MHLYPSSRPAPSHSLEALRGWRQHPITPLLLPLSAAQALAGHGYLSLGQPWATGQLPSKACLHLRLVLGGSGAEGTGGLWWQASRTAGPTWVQAQPCHPPDGPVGLMGLGATIMWLWKPPSLRAEQSISIFPPYWLWAPPSLGRCRCQLAYSLFIR